MSNESNLSVAKAHEIFRKYMGPVDQVDVIAQMMRISRELVSAWHKKQLAFLIQTAISNAHSHYNLDPSCKAEFFTGWYNKFFCITSRDESKRGNL